MSRRSSLFLNCFAAGWFSKRRDHDAQDADAPVAQVVDQLQGVGVVGDAEIGADLLSLDVAREDAEQQVHLVLEVLKEPQLDVGVIARKHACRVVVERSFPPNSR